MSQPFQIIVIAALLGLCLLTVEGKKTTLRSNDVKRVLDEGMQSQNLTFYSIYFDANQTKPGFKVMKGIHEKCYAFGAYEDRIEEDGWARLYIYPTAVHFGRAVVSSELLVLAAGELEAYFTHARIYQAMRNLKDAHFGKGGEPPEELTNFLRQQKNFTTELGREGIKIPVTDPMWMYYSTLRISGFQMAGMADGLQKYGKPGQNVTLDDVLLLNAAGDISDILQSLKKGEDRVAFDTDASEPNFVHHQRLSCSSIVKGSPESIGNIFAGHTTWNSYSSMLRIFKFYDYSGIPLMRVGNTGSRIQNSKFMFSSRPGCLTSQDDFTVLDDDMVVMETTNGVLNTSLYDLVTPKALLSYQRSVIANFLGGDGNQWTKMFGMNNSGTYNNQWIVVDMKKANSTGALLPGFLWISEQMPGLYISSDETNTYVSQGHTWWSYNIPFFRKMYEYSGYLDMYKKHGNQYSYTECPRCLMFRRNASDVHDEKDVKSLLQYNDWQHDPLSLGSPANAISSRWDLIQNKTLAHAFGGNDCKVVDWKSMNSGNPIVQTRNGPTYDEQPVFTWDDEQWQDVPHLGHPTAFKFPYVSMQWVEKPSV